MAEEPLAAPTYITDEERRAMALRQRLSKDRQGYCRLCSAFHDEPPGGPACLVHLADRLAELERKVGLR